MPTIPYPIGTGANVIGPGSSTAGNLVSWGNDDGTVLADTVVSVDSSGNLDGVGTVNGVKVYRALLTQSSTDAPVATVLENSIGAVGDWIRSDEGNYVLSPVEPLFTADKTFTMISLNSQAVSEPKIASIQWDTEMQVEIQTGWDGTKADGVLFRTCVQILVYPAS